MLLSHLSKNTPAVIKDYNRRPGSAAIISRLIEMGLVKGSTIQISHTSPFGRDPIAVEVKGAMIGIGRAEADMIIVEGL
jgi:Fe2+ transport system protein FeoA